MVTDTRVGTDAVAHHFNIGTEFFCNIGQLIHEADARSQHGVGGVLGEFRAFDVHYDQPIMVAIEGGVQLAHDIQGLRVATTNHDAIRAHEIFDCRAFFEKLRIGYDAEIQFQAALLQLISNRRLNFVGGADRHRAFVDDDFIFGHAAADIARGGQHIFEIGRTVFVGRRANGDELNLAKGDGTVDVTGKLQTPGGHIAPYHFQQAGFMDGDAAAFEDCNLGRIQIQAQNMVSHFRQACATDESDVAGADNG